MAQCHKRAFVTPPKQGDSSTWTAPELTRSWSEDRPVRVSRLGLAGRIQQPYNRSQRSSAHRVHFTAAAYRADLRAAGDQGPAPGGSGVPVPVGGFRHTHRQAPALDGARLQRVVVKLDQGAVGREPGAGAGRGPFPRPTADPDRAATGVHPGGAVEGSESAGISQASGRQSLDNSAGGQVGGRWNCSLCTEHGR